MSSSYKFYSDTKDIMKKYVNDTEDVSKPFITIYVVHSRTRPVNLCFHPQVCFHVSSFLFEISAKYHTKRRIKKKQDQSL